LVFWAVPNPDTVEKYIKANGRTEAEVTAVYEMLKSRLNELHDANIYHLDCKWDNYLVSMSTAPASSSSSASSASATELTVWVIDLGLSQTSATLAVYPRNECCRTNVWNFNLLKEDGLRFWNGWASYRIPALSLSQKKEFMSKVDLLMLGTHFLLHILPAFSTFTSLRSSIEAERSVLERALNAEYDRLKNDWDPYPVPEVAEVRRHLGLQEDQEWCDASSMWIRSLDKADTFASAMVPAQQSNAPVSSQLTAVQAAQANNAALEQQQQTRIRNALATIAERGTPTSGTPPTPAMPAVPPPPPPRSIGTNRRFATKKSTMFRVSRALQQP